MIPVADAIASAETLYWWMAVLGTVIFIVKLGLSFVGGSVLEHADIDPHALDAAGGGDPFDHGSSEAFTFFSLQSILAFFMGMGWIGLACLKQWDLGPGISFVGGGVFGLALMFLNAWLMFQVRRLNAEGRVDLSTSVGRTGRVYLRIPARGEGAGQVEVSVSGRRKIIRAISNGPAIESFAEVVVLEVIDHRELVVQPVKAAATANV
jgi:hypothetical protein